MAKIQKLKKQNKSLLGRVSVTEVFEGPLPHPNLIAKYEQIMPGATDRIFAMAEKQQKHRHNLEASVVQSNIRNERLGMFFALFITTGALAIALILVMSGHEIGGFTTLVGILLFHAYNFFQQKNIQKKELEKTKNEDSESTDKA